ncbi:hypothetical protein Patl1_20463 [Pistacia atlantica]|uniref:Uncharacterized protein n=1 Tax=Pistacia atlantica TaxID=434234 RepID=A0ACC1BN26_9ROSI|nr:hypothetical protein Patl1_20463 [Pistacia atlantica]
MIFQGVTIIVDMYLLTLEGCDVLGAQWLTTLGPIVLCTVLY